MRDAVHVRLGARRNLGDRFERAVRGALGLPGVATGTLRVKSAVMLLPV